MNDPRRFIEQDAGGLERELVASMRNDAPPAAARARALAAFGVGAAVTATASATTAASLAAKTALPSVAALAAKWLIVGVGASVLAAGVAHQAGWSRVRPHGARPAAEHAAPARIASVSHETKPGLAPTAAASFDAQGPSPSSRPSAGARVQSAEVRSVPDVELAKEVRALDRARRAALAHDPERALRLVAAYRSEFPRGKLAPEATVQHIEALIATGQKPAAANLARGFLRSDPSGPLAERVRTLLSEAASP
jgi:hypothetical protein